MAVVIADTATCCIFPRILVGVNSNKVQHLCSIFGKMAHGMVPGHPELRQPIKVAIEQVVVQIEVNHLMETAEGVYIAGEQVAVEVEPNGRIRDEVLERFESQPERVVSEQQ